jgi:uncharacterized protein DUF5825
VRFDALQVWRDHDEEARRLGAFMRLGSFPSVVSCSRLAETVFGSGGRLVVVDEVVDFDTLDPADASRFLELLRELTSYGIAVGWRLRTGLGDPRWRDLSHLFPPSEFLIPGGAADQTAEFWRRHFYYGLCVMRRGPGLIEVRDRRSGRIRCLRFTSPLHLAAIARLEQGAPASSLEPEVLAEFEAARVVTAIGDTRLWLPCRFRRSPLSPVGFW